MPGSARFVRAAVILFAAANGALAQAPSPESEPQPAPADAPVQELEAPPRFEAGVRYWGSTGSARHAHNASNQTFMGRRLGNPTSVLSYDGLDASTLELHGRLAFASRGFVKGMIGMGEVKKGTFTDQDFYLISGRQFMYLETVSQVSGDLQYGTVDVGGDVWRSGGHSIGLFGGLQQWSETLDGNGLTETVDAFPAESGGNLPGSVRVISNKRTWRAVRMGAVYRGEFGRTRINAELALVPLAEYRNEDSHLLRTDLGPSPNIIATGDGTGVQLELEVRHRFPSLFNLEAGLGYRYWKLEADGGTMSFGGRSSVPVTELVSERKGFTLTLAKRW